MMKKTLLFITALFVSSAFATQKVGKNYQDAVENVPAAFHNHIKESTTPALNYVNQPPMIPHSVANYQVTKNTNQCLNCHSPENSELPEQQELVQRILQIVTAMLLVKLHHDAISVYIATYRKQMLLLLCQMNLSQ